MKNLWLHNNVILLNFSLWHSNNNFNYYYYFFFCTFFGVFLETNNKVLWDLGPLFTEHVVIFRDATNRKDFSWPQSLNIWALPQTFCGFTNSHKWHFVLKRICKDNILKENIQIRLVARIRPGEHMLHCSSQTSKYFHFESTVHKLSSLA